MAEHQRRVKTARMPAFGQILAGEFAAAFKEDTFTFVIGNEHERYTVHAELLNNISVPLTALMTLPMQESRSKTVVMQYVEPQIFSLFTEWLYTRTYDSGLHPAIMPVNRLPNVISFAPPQQLCLHCATSWSPVLSANYGSGTRHQFQDSTCSSCGICSTICKADNSQDLRSKLASMLKLEDDGSSPIQRALLVNTKLYIFAECYMIDVLRRLCVLNVYRLLCVLDLPPPRIADELVLLLRLVFKNTPGEGPQAIECESLRHLLCMFAAVKIKTVSRADSYIDLMAEGGDITRTVMRLVGTLT